MTRVARVGRNKMDLALGDGKPLRLEGECGAALACDPSPSGKKPFPPENAEGQFASPWRGSELAGVVFSL